MFENMSPARWKILKRNTGLGGVVKTAFLLLVIGLVAVLAFREQPLLAVAGLTGFCIPYLLKEPMVSRPGPTSKTLQVFAWSLFGLAFIGQTVRDWFEQFPLAVVILWFSLGLYLGLFFWFWSDERIEKAD